MNYYDFDVRIAYADTDRLGVVYYANYLVLFERGRTEYLRSLGMRYRDLEDKHKTFLPVMEAHCDYFAPASYDDLIRVRTFIAELGKAHILFRYEISNVDSGQRVAVGTTKHPVVNRDWKPIRVPAVLKNLLAPHVASNK